MTILSWKLSTTPSPTQTPFAWILYVDGINCLSIAQWAPYVGPGPYSVDLTQIPAGPMMPRDGNAHNYSLALQFQNGAMGPQSPSISITLPALMVAVATSQLPSALPTADTLVST